MHSLMDQKWVRNMVWSLQQDWKLQSQASFHRSGNRLGVFPHVERSQLQKHSVCIEEWEADLLHKLGLDQRDWAALQSHAIFQDLAKPCCLKTLILDEPTMSWSHYREGTSSCAYENCGPYEAVVIGQEKQRQNC